MAVASGACSPTTSLEMAYRLPLLQKMAHGRYLGEDQPRHPRTPQGTPQKGSSAQRGSSGPKRRRGGRLAQSVAAQGLCGAASALGGGTDDFLDRPAKEDELRDYERLCASGEALVYAAMIRLMLRRLAR